MRNYRQINIILESGDETMINVRVTEKGIEIARYIPSYLITEKEVNTNGKNR